MAKRKMHLDTVYRGLENLFNEKVKPQDVNGREVYAELSQDGIEYLIIKMDTKSLTNLLNLAKSEHLKFEEKHPDNNLELFVFIETEKANYWQSHFTKWQYDAKQKEWYYTLERWKLAITVYWGTLRSYTPELNPELNPEIENYKAYFSRNNTFNQVSTVIDTAVNQVKPIWPNVEPNKYYHDFLQRVDFVSLQNEVEISEGINVCMQISWSFEKLQTDIKKAFEVYKKKLPSQDLRQNNTQQIAIMLPLQKAQEMANNYTLIKEPYASIKQLTDKFRSTGKPLTAANFKPVFEVWLGAILHTLHTEYLLVDKMLKEIALLLPTQNTTTSDAPPKETEIQPFESLFYKPENAEGCLSILRKLEPPVVDVANNYVGKNKGIFSIWVNILKQAGLVKHFTDKEYKDILNYKINGLKLSKDASEFRKTYNRLVEKPIEIKALLSRLSQEGKIGK